MKTLVAVLCLLLPIAAFAQKKSAARATQTAAKAIRFDGAPQFSQQELLAAAGLTPQAALDANAIKARAKQLNDTGYFDAIKFKFDSKSILFSLTPTAQLYPVRLENLPLMPGKDLDDQLRARLPLYHGLLPASGSAVDGARTLFEELLTALGTPVTVKATLTSGLGPQKITAMNFAIATPPTKIGAIQFTGVSSAMQSKARVLALGQAESDYDTTYSATNLRRAFEDFYQEQGYAAAKLQVTQLTPLLVAGTLRVPFAIAVNEGGLYKLGAIAYPAGALLPRSEVEKVLAKYPPNSGRPLDLFLLAVRDAYHARGYLDCEIHAQESFDEKTRIVDYALTIEPGQPYRFASVTFDGAPAPMLTRLNKLWTLAPGAPFDESYLSNFAALAQKKDKTLAKWMQNLLVTFDTQPDPDAHSVAVLFHFAKAAQPPAVGPAAPAAR